jgi:hypothetical protein
LIVKDIHRKICFLNIESEPVSRYYVNPLLILKQRRCSALQHENLFENFHTITSIPLEYFSFSAGSFPAANPPHDADAGKPFAGLLAPVFRTAFSNTILLIVV